MYAYLIPGLVTFTKYYYYFYDTIVIILNVPDFVCSVYVCSTVVVEHHHQFDNGSYIQCI